MKPLVCLCLVLPASALYPAISRASEPPKKDIDQGTEDMAFSMDVEPGTFFVIVVHSSKEFVPSYVGLRPPPETTTKPIANATPGVAAHLFSVADVVQDDEETYTVTIPHTDKYAGYAIVLKKRDESAQDAFIPRAGADLGAAEARFDSLKSKEQTKSKAREILSDYGRVLGPISVFVYTGTQSPWRVELGGGFAVSWLTDERYFAEKQTSGESILRRDKDNESAVRPLAVAFIHVPQPWAKDYLSISLGLGANADADLSLLPGVTLRMGRVANLTFGFHVGTIKTKPLGTAIGKPVDPAVLANPDTKTIAKPFFALTYSFLGKPSETVQKPFAIPETNGQAK